MSKRYKEGPALYDSFPTKPPSASSFHLVIALSIPVYLFLAWIITSWLPMYYFLALVPAVFAIHSAVILLSGGKK